MSIMPIDKACNGKLKNIIMFILPRDNNASG